MDRQNHNNNPIPQLPPMPTTSFTQSLAQSSTAVPLFSNMDAFSRVNGISNVCSGPEHGRVEHSKAGSRSRPGKRIGTKNYSDVEV